MAPNSQPDQVVVLGAGFCGLALAERALSLGQSVWVSSRDAERRGELTLRGFGVLDGNGLGEELGPHLSPSTLLAVTFPPDGHTDAELASRCAQKASIVYLSTSGVYGDRRGLIDQTTPVADAPDAHIEKRLAAEASWRAAGATVLRCPGIYGSERGLHRRVLRGDHRIGGNGENFTSRIHHHDLAELMLATFGRPSETFVVGDLEPARQVDIVSWICKTHGAAMPEFVPIDAVHRTLRADRRIDSSYALDTLGVTLRYPTYREGMK